MIEQIPGGESNKLEVSVGYHIGELEKLEEGEGCNPKISMAELLSGGLATIQGHVPVPKHKEGFDLAA